MRERPLAAVPRSLVALLALALCAQLAISAWRPAVSAVASDLPVPPRAGVLQTAALGEPGVLARFGMLWLQAFDYQPGISLSFRDLDYGRVEGWLACFLALDPAFEYPLLAAARLYGEVADPPRQRRMIAFIRSAFADDPAARWRWMTHAVFLAKHRLHDLDLALDLARELAAVDEAAPVPGWARQMHIFVLEDMGELDSARVILGGLLDSGRITDPHEQFFLSQRLAELEARLAGD